MIIPSGNAISEGTNQVESKPWQNHGNSRAGADSLHPSWHVKFSRADWQFGTWIMDAESWTMSLNFLFACSSSFFLCGEGWFAKRVVRFAAACRTTLTCWLGKKLQDKEQRCRAVQVFAQLIFDDFWPHRWPNTCPWLENLDFLILRLHYVDFHSISSGLARPWIRFGIFRHFVSILHRQSGSMVLGGLLSTESLLVYGT